MKRPLELQSRAARATRRAPRVVSADRFIVPLEHRSGLLASRDLPVRLGGAEVENAPPAQEAHRLLQMHQGPACFSRISYRGMPLASPMADPVARVQVSRTILKATGQDHGAFLPLMLVRRDLAAGRKPGQVQDGVIGWNPPDLG